MIVVLEFTLTCIKPPKSQDLTAKKNIHKPSAFNPWPRSYLGVIFSIFVYPIPLQQPQNKSSSSNCLQTRQNISQIFTQPWTSCSMKRSTKIPLFSDVIVYWETLFHNGVESHYHNPVAPIQNIIIYIYHLELVSTKYG